MADKFRIFRSSLSGGYEPEDWFEMSVKAFADEVPDADDLGKWEHVTVVDMAHYKRFPFGNMNCSQGFRHRDTGVIIPDFCRQCGTCPDIWNKTHARQLSAAENSPVFRFIQTEADNEF